MSAVCLFYEKWYIVELGLIMGKRRFVCEIVEICLERSYSKL